MSRRNNRTIEFSRALSGNLEREITRPGHDTYTHRCTEDVFKEVLHFLEAHIRKGHSLETIAEAIDVPYTQVNVALEFLKERGILEQSGRKTFVAVGYRTALFENGMCEWHALSRDS